METNWASEGLGADIVGCSSCVEGCESENVLSPDLSKIWLSDPQCSLPQWLCISLKRVHKHAYHRRDSGNSEDPKGAFSTPTQDNAITIRTVGWHCWHPYGSNPRKVVLHVSSDGSRFRKWDTFSLASNLKSEEQHKHNLSPLFCCAPINAALYPYIALEVVETFASFEHRNSGGPSQCYMNRIYMYSEEVPSSPLIINTMMGSQRMISLTPYHRDHGVEDRGSDSRGMNNSSLNNNSRDINEGKKMRYNE